ncbi:PEP-CTERM sorting domain-containing protein [Bythopirellula goksoeyrii]|uniref:PEP-CTERM protein-sorting domain-containing protein n=1 Tax=Bythopirellula goksoeyrii TaxID=1400387 RepID=A0A5B9QC94_9BACT|nr:PEP-CTERM sorting domain-containing protein [Bythopirellula goksoeyrii]QEG35409.1 hypothetical protein Pr1d_27080 [Bythopirellula goksoeyrii]
MLLLSRLVAVAALLVFSVALISARSRADVIPTADVVPPTGAEVFTVDPNGRGISGSAGRGVTADRLLRQTFQSAVSFDVRGIWVSQKVNSGGTDGGYTMTIYEVADVLANPIDLSGTQVAQIVIPAGAGSIPATTNQSLGFSLNGSDVFTLAARGDLANGDATGYAFEISNSDGITEIGVIGHTNHADDDYYAPGVFYTESGSISGPRRDAGVGLSSVPFVPEPTSLVLLSIAGSLAVLRRQSQLLSTQIQH